MGEHEDCRECRNWKGCPGKWYWHTENGERVEEEWYHYGEMRWCPQQILWILSYKDIFKAGDWPTKHEESGESKHFSSEAYFIKAGIAISELEARLDRTPNRGELLITQVEDGRTLTNLSPGAREVLMYVKGWRRKSIGFRRWLREVYYQKTGEKHQLVGVS